MNDDREDLYPTVPPSPRDGEPEKMDWVPAPPVRRRRRKFPWVFGIVLVSLLVISATAIALRMDNPLFFQASQPQEDAHQARENQGTPPASPSTDTPAVIYPNNIADIVEKTSPAVVKIDTEVHQGRSSNPFLQDPFFRQFFGGHLDPKPDVQNGMGSGFIISEDGYILTNQHVIDGADKIYVTVSGYEQRFEAELVGADFDLDLAVLKIKAANKLPTLSLGNSEDLKVGNWVIAIGNPYGLDHTVTVGVVSAKGRPVTIPTREGVRQYENLLQVDAAINPGNSGGPLLNLNGEVVGINTAINAEAQGIGFAIPTTTIEPVLNQLIEKGKVIRPYIGVSIQDVTPELKEYFGLQSTKGAIVSFVQPGSPAEKAGLRQGDTIISIDDTPVENANHLVELIQQKEIGKTTVLLVVRQGQQQYVTVTVGERPGLKD